MPTDFIVRPSVVDPSKNAYSKEYPYMKRMDEYPSPIVIIRLPELVEDTPLSLLIDMYENGVKGAEIPIRLGATHYLEDNSSDGESVDV